MPSRPLTDSTSASAGEVRRRWCSRLSAATSKRGENPLLGAGELLEETGYQAGVGQLQYAVDANGGAGVAHLFLAKGAVKVAEVNGGRSGKNQELVLLTRAKSKLHCCPCWRLQGVPGHRHGARLRV
ncbi:MAG: hypothetical protein R3E39_15605 [Anaerolineae bacterium]